MRHARVATSWVGIILLVIASPIGADELAEQEPGVGKLTFIKTIEGPHLRSVNSLVTSPDGKYLYATAWSASTIVVYACDAKTGLLTEVQQLKSDRDLDGCTSMYLSLDGKFAVANAFRSKTIVLFERDVETGRLRYLDAAREGERGVEGLSWSIDCCFSPDGKYVYACDPKQAGRGAEDITTGSITAFRITANKKLKWVEANRGAKGNFTGTRGVMPHPKKNILFATALGTSAAPAGRVMVLKPDPKTGKTTVQQTIEDDQGEVTCLQGAMVMALSPDARFLYISVGRFFGDQGVAVFEIVGESLRFVEEHEVDVSPLRNLNGPNQIAIAPDGRSLYIAGSISNSLACFQRDPMTGKLKYRETLADGTGVGDLRMAAGVATSLNNRFVYVTAEGGASISIYKRSVGSDQ